MINLYSFGRIHYRIDTSVYRLPLIILNAGHATATFGNDFLSSLKQYLLVLVHVHSTGTQGCKYYFQFRLTTYTNTHRT